MARKVLLFDDLHGGAATQTVAYSYRGVDYEIDLDDDNAARFDDVLRNWILHSRRAVPDRESGGAASAPIAPPVAAPPEVVRTWARNNGFKVSDKGRISDRVIRAYYEAHGMNGSTVGVRGVLRRT